MIVEKVDENFVMVVGPRVKRRLCNIKHLKLLPTILDIKKGAGDDEVISAMVEARLVEKPKPLPKPKPKKEAPKPEKKSLLKRTKKK